MKSISFNIRFLTWVLIVGTILVILSKVWNELLFLESEKEFRLLGIVLPAQINPTIYKGLIVLYCFSLVFILFHLNTFRKVMTDFYNDLIFSNQNGIQLRQIANGILYFTIFLEIFKIFLGIYSLPFLKVDELAVPLNHFHNDPAYKNGYIFGRILGRSLSTILPFLIISQAILLLSEMIKKGHLLKSENDLTI